MMENPQEIIVNGNLLVHLDETDSTNRFIKELKTDKKYRMVVVASSFQTAGRGQGCNRWESEQGKNITFSILIHPDAILPHVQFVISMAISLAIKESLNGYFDDVSIKWPNDIYYKDKKICGILIENNLSGCVIKDSILGIGINVNQRKFVSDAPNPVSMFQILGKETDKEEVLNEVIRHFDYYLDKMNHGDGQHETADEQHDERVSKRTHHPFVIQEWSHDVFVDHRCEAAVAAEQEHQH